MLAILDRIKIEIYCVFFLIVSIFLVSGCIILDDDDDDYPIAYIDLDIDPFYVYPVYDHGSHEWGWSFDMTLYETNGVDVALHEMRVTFYTLDGDYINTIDYSDEIAYWFGTDYLPAYGAIYSDAYWTNTDGSPEGWKAYFEFGGVDAYGNWIGCGGEVFCYDGYQAAGLECSFNPNPVQPVYNHAYHEWRWYVDWNVYEVNGVDVTIKCIVLDFYDLAGNYLYSEDFSYMIYEWFGSNRIPAYGSLNCLDMFWVNNDGSGYGTEIKYNYEGVDSYGNIVETSCWLTLNSAYQSGYEDSPVLESRQLTPVKQTETGA